MWRTGRSKQSRWLSTGRRACSTTRSQLRATTTSRSLSCIWPRSLLGESQLLPCCSSAIYLLDVRKPTYFFVVSVMPISTLLKALLSFLQMSQLTWSPSSGKCPAEYHGNLNFSPPSLLLNFVTAWFLQAWSRAWLCYYPTTARWWRRPDRVDVALHHCPIIVLLSRVITLKKSRVISKLIMYFRMKFLQRARCFGGCFRFQ